MASLRLSAIHHKTSYPERTYLYPHERTYLYPRTNCSTPWERNPKVILVYLLSSLRSKIRQLSLVHSLLEATCGNVVCGLLSASWGPGLHNDANLLLRKDVHALFDGKYWAFVPRGGACRSHLLDVFERRNASISRTRCPLTPCQCRVSLCPLCLVHPRYLSITSNSAWHYHQDLRRINL